MKQRIVKVVDARPPETEYDLAMCVGTQHYPWPQDFSEEARAQGVSKSISRKNIPFGLRPGMRMVFIHPRAQVAVTAEGMSLIDLATELLAEHDDRKKVSSYDIWNLVKITSPESAPLTATNTLVLVGLLRKADKAGDLKRIEDKYGIVYRLGYFGFTHLTSIQFVSDGEMGLPDELRGQGIEVVRVEYGNEI